MADIVKISQPFSTRQVAKAFNVESWRITQDVQRQGHFRGMKPHKGRNGFYLWRAAEVSAALGRAVPERTPGDLAERIEAGAGIDLDDAAAVASWALMTSRTGPTPGARLGAMLEDVADLCELVHATAARVGFALGDENHMTREHWLKANALESRLRRELEGLAGFLAWIHPAAEVV